MKGNGGTKQSLWRKPRVGGGAKGTTNGRGRNFKKGRDGDRVYSSGYNGEYRTERLLGVNLEKWKIKTSFLAFFSMTRAKCAVGVSCSK